MLAAATSGVGVTGTNPPVTSTGSDSGASPAAIAKGSLTVVESAADKALRLYQQAQSLRKLDGGKPAESQPKTMREALKDAPKQKPKLQSKDLKDKTPNLETTALANIRNEQVGKAAAIKAEKQKLEQQQAEDLQQEAQARRDDCKGLPYA